MDGTYERDFAEWGAEQARLLRSRRFDQIDAEHVAEEIEGLVRSDKRALASQIERVLMHLLKWRHQPNLRSSSWRRSIRHGREEIARLLADSHSLLRDVPDHIQARYRSARLDAIDETGLPASAFARECPFTLDQILRDAGMGEVETEE